MADVQAEINRISEELKKVNKELQQEKKDRIADQNKQQAQLSEIVGIILDYEAASKAVVRYSIRLDGRYNNLMLALQDAVISFNEFIRLPASSNKLDKYWDAAWAALATIMPMLRISPAWVRLEQTAQAELKTANNILKDTGALTKMVTLAQRGHNIADWVAKENTLAGKLRDVRILPPKVDASRGPIKVMMAESNAAHAALESAADTIYEEYRSRLISAVVGTQYSRTESMEDMANRLLPALNYLEPDEAEQVKRRFLFEILRAWAPQNVIMVTIVYRTGESVRIDGLNDTQQDKIMEWFGPDSGWMGGHVPPLATVWYFLYVWNVPEKKESSGGSIFGFG